MRRRIGLILVLVLGAAVVWAVVVWTRPTALVLTGIVTTNDVIVSPQITGQVTRLLVKEGDTVAKDQLLAVIAPQELQQDRAFYASSAAQAGSQVRESEAALRYEEQQTADQIRQAQAMLASIQAQRAAAAADLENARLTNDRVQKMVQQGVVATGEADQARTAFESARAKVEGLDKQADAQRAAIALARSSAEQIAVRRSELEANRHQQAAADAQRAKADVRLGYTELHAPLAGIVDVRAVRPGEVVTPAQPLLTLINPDDLWVRADVEETYIDRVRLGDHLTVRLPSGAERDGVVFFRGVDAGFATQRDVSRTKRDIRTFEIRLRVDNRDRRLATGMTAYVLLPLR
ncbi:MAG TPA: efflux RND transporter periplasmic adaptor subunit [Vicinamibacterales bacterium]|nr:efflux RND transporter periplasmic adaptor subunit [Vicinamibacterales bacterium]